MSLTQAMTELKAAAKDAQAAMNLTYRSFTERATPTAILALLAALEESQADYGCAVDSVAQLQEEVFAVHAQLEAQAAPVGWKLVPDDQGMTDEQGEAIAKMANCCGGIAYDIYRVALAAAPAYTPPEPPQ